jgi:hypothetical protein
MRFGALRCTLSACARFQNRPRLGIGLVAICASNRFFPHPPPPPAYGDPSPEKNRPSAADRCAVALDLPRDVGARISIFLLRDLISTVRVKPWRGRWCA